MFVKAKKINKKFVVLLNRLINRLENNNNPVFHNNGEKRFIETLFDLFVNTKENKKISLFDIGANEGHYTQILLDKSSALQLNNVEIHSFEPVAVSFLRLQNKFEQNNQVKLVKKAASDLDGIQTIFFNQEGSTLASLYERNLAHYNMSMNQQEQIETIRLDEYISSHQIKHIDFIKLDVEGHEMQVLKGLGEYLNNEFIDFIQFEYGGANIDSHTHLMDIYSFFQDKGFQIAKVKRNGLELRKYSPTSENFIYSNYVVISENILNKI